MPQLMRDAPADVVTHDSDARTVTVRLCRWNEPRPVRDPDSPAYREQYEPGSITAAPHVSVSDRHAANLIGRGDPATLRDDGTGPVIDITIARTTAGNDLLAMLDADVIRSVSMEVEPVDPPHRIPEPGELVTRNAAVLHGVAFAFRPAHDAPVLAIRDQPTGEPAMPTDTDTAPGVRDTPPPATDPPAGTDPPTVNVVDQATLNRAMDDMRRDIIAAMPAGLADTAHPLAQYRTLDDAHMAAWTDPAVSRSLTRELVDQVTANNPGVMPPAWLTTVFGIIDRGRPTITAFGARGLPESGMDINWPYFDGNLSALVGEQLIQKTAITSVRVDLQRGTETLRTWAGGSDIAYQLIRRSDPSYRDNYFRIMYAAYSAVTDAAAALAVELHVAPIATWDSTVNDDGKSLAAALFAASVAVEAATGQPAEFGLAATDVYLAMGGSLVPGQYGTQNVGGTAQASTLAVNVSGLPIYHDHNLTDGALIVSNSQAGAWFEDGPMPVSAEDVEKLGQNVAVWGMGNFAAFLPGAFPSINVTIPTPVTELVATLRAAGTLPEPLSKQIADSDSSSTSSRRRRGES